jgi:hypothetical protein
MKRLLGCLIGLALVAAACGQQNSTSKAGTASNRAAPTASTAAAAADPLTGEWRQQYTCADVVRTLQKAGFAEVLPKLLVDSQLAANPSSAHLCSEREAKAKVERIARFQDGHVLFFDPPNQELGLDATYNMVDDHTFSANDAGQNIDGTYTFRWHIQGDRLTFKLVGRAARDPYFVAAWEAAPFHRAG